MGIATATFSLSITGAGDHNAFQPKVHKIADTVCQTVGAEQQAMRLGTPFYRLLADGSQQLCTFDAERSIPGVLRITKKA